MALIAAFFGNQLAIIDEYATCTNDCMSSGCPFRADFITFTQTGDHPRCKVCAEADLTIYITENMFSPIGKNMGENVAIIIADVSDRIVYPGLKKYHLSVVKKDIYVNYSWKEWEKVPIDRFQSLPTDRFITWEDIWSLLALLHGPMSHIKPRYAIWRCAGDFGNRCLDTECLNRACFEVKGVGFCESCFIYRYMRVEDHEWNKALDITKYTILPQIEQSLRDLSNTR